MANPVLHILQPAHGAKIAGTGDVRLQAQLLGSAAGLFFKWYSTLNPKATASQPELNTADHSVNTLDWTTSLGVGTHVLSLSAADRENNDMASIQAITRSGFTGGAPDPSNPEPRVVHRFVADLRLPAASGARLSRASTTLEALAPCRWARETALNSGTYVKDEAYHALNGIRYRFRFEPNGPADASRTADILPPVTALTFFIADNKPYVRWSGALPANLGTGAYVLTLWVESLDGAVGHSVSRTVTLT